MEPWGLLQHDAPLKHVSMEVHLDVNVTGAHHVIGVIAGGECVVVTAATAAAASATASATI